MRNKALSKHVVVGLLAGLATTTLVAAPVLAQSAPSKTATKADAPATPAKPPTKKQKDAARKAYAEGEKAFNSRRLLHGATTPSSAPTRRSNRRRPTIRSRRASTQMSKTDDAIAAYEAFLANPDAAKAGDQKVSEAQARPRAP